MPGTRTAPTVDGAAALQLVSVSYIDSDDEEKTYSFYADGGATAAEIEGYIDSLVPASNASIWKVEVSMVYEGAKLKSNASNALKDSVDDVIRVTYKNPTTKQTFRNYLPAPLETILVPGTSQVDTADTLFTGWLAGAAPLIPAGFNPVNTSYNQHREINESTSIG